MYVVFVKNQFCLLGNEYFGTDGKQIIGYHDPNRASHFNTEREAKDFCKLFDYEGRKIEPLWKHVNLFSRCKYVYRKFSLLDKSMDVRYDPKKHSADDVLNWRMMYAKAAEKSVSQKTYSSWPDLYSVFKHLWSVQSYHSRDYKHTYHTVQLRTSKSADFETFKSEFDKVFDFCTYVDDEKRKVFPIFDHELNSYESRYLVCESRDKCYIQNQVQFLSKSNRAFAGTLKQCFEQMKLHYWYE